MTDVAAIDWRRGRILQAALPLARPLATAHGPIERRNALVVALEDEAGRIGWGEAAPLPEFGTETFEACRKRLVARLDGAAPDADLTKPCADFAWSTATRDLAARQSGESLAERLALVVPAVTEQRKGQLPPRRVLRVVQGPRDVSAQVRGRRTLFG